MFAILLCFLQEKPIVKANKFSHIKAEYIYSVGVQTFLGEVSSSITENDYYGFTK